MAKTDSNIADGRNSYDVEVGGLVVPFFNRNVTPYATESSSPKFDLVPVEKQKDIMLNVARMHAQQEYNRIMELVTVLQNQAAGIRRRLELTDMVHAAKYEFQVYHGQSYWLVHDTLKQFNRLVRHASNDWASGPPAEYEYLAEVKWLGDHTWIEIDEKGNHVT